MNIALCAPRPWSLSLVYLLDPHGVPETLEKFVQVSQLITGASPPLSILLKQVTVAGRIHLGVDKVRLTQPDMHATCTLASKTCGGKRSWWSAGGPCAIRHLPIDRSPQDRISVAFTRGVNNKGPCDAAHLA